MSPLELVRLADGMRLVNEDGEVEYLRLLPPLGPGEIAALEYRIPCAMPREARELFEFSRGFENGPVESVDFSGLTEFGMEEVFPCAIPIAHDGFGNYWVIDLTSQSETWGPVLFVCHDPAVIIFQSARLNDFISELLKLGNPPYASALDEVHEKAAFAVWKDLSGMRSPEDFASSPETELRDFAMGLDPDWLISDLRNASVGDGYPWGRFGPRTANRRMGEERVFAIKKQKSGWQRLLGR